ncbi:hypothetical protein EV122DRAFT_285532, partial [Schizophyllum commune]
LFSLISIRLVLGWLTVDEIRAALQSVKKALAPGGRIHLTEAQMFSFYAPEEAQVEFPRHVPYSVKSFGPPSSSALRTGLDLEEKDTTSPSKLADTERATTLATHPHIRPPLPLSPSLSPTDLRTIEGATSKMFGHFVGMVREAWVELLPTRLRRLGGG